jgi:hypothetical protein
LIGKGFLLDRPARRRYHRYRPLDQIDDAKIPYQTSFPFDLVGKKRLDGSQDLGLNKVGDNLGTGGLKSTDMSDQDNANKMAKLKHSYTHVLDLTVRFVELANVELGGFEELGLSDVDVLKGEDSLGGLLDLSSNSLRYELLDQLLQLALALPLHDLVHLGPDLPDLSGLSVRGLLDLLPVLSGESNGEKPDEVSIGSSDIDVSLNQRLPLSNQRSDLVGGEVHAVERGKTVLALLLCMQNIEAQW